MQQFQGQMFLNFHDTMKHRYLSTLNYLPHIDRCDLLNESPLFNGDTLVMDMHQA